MKNRSSTRHQQEGSWEDFRQEVKKVEPELFSIIEKISPDKKYPLLKITLPYGEKITDFGTIRLLNKEGSFQNLDDSSISNHFKDQLGYSPTPLILQLKNSAEAFVQADERIIPLNIFSPGDLYGLFEVMVPLTNCPFTPFWSVTSGARSVFMGAKVTDVIGYQRLRAEYGVPEEPPQSLSDQWEYIKMIAQHSTTQHPWTSEILVFTKKWFQPNDDDVNWLRFHYYIARKSWIQSRSTRIKSEFSIMWEVFGSAIGTRRLKPSHYMVSMVMHNLFLANGTAPGFKPTNDSKLLLPSQLIEDAYENVYRLKNYAPIIMAPVILSSKEPVMFYSLAYPTLLEGTPAIRKKPSMISELRDLKKLMQMLMDTLEKHHEPVFEFVKNTQFECFHTELDKFGEIKDSKELVKDDPCVSACMKRFKGKIFPYQGPFFHGFLRIKKKNSMEITI